MSLKISFSSFMIQPFVVTILLPFVGFCLGSMASSVPLLSLTLVFSCLILSFATFAFNVFTIPKIPYWEFFFESFNIDGLLGRFDIYINQTILLFLGVILVISLLVHVYTLGSMRHDPNLSRFVGLLSLFTSMMMFFVSSSNLYQMFMGWEGMSLVSSLLIGFFFKKETATLASFKAFMMNRVGDIGFLITLVIIASTSKDFSLKTLVINPPVHSDLIMGLLFLSVMAKSAQFGFHTWLSDAMEGPTPGSAFIHSATMVTAGVFLMIRLGPLLQSTLYVKHCVVFVGLFTSLWCSYCALFLNDIKRVLAASTSAQIGLMIAACGVGAYEASFLHLLTHAFFKALLFLGTGCIIHTLSHEHDLRRMGGLCSTIRLVCFFMILAGASLSGIFLLPGAFSKGALFASISQYNPFDVLLNPLDFCLLALSALTSSYTTRLVYLVFLAPPQFNEKVRDYLHKPPKKMIISLVLLGLLCLVPLDFFIPLYLPPCSTLMRWGPTSITMGSSFLTFCLLKYREKTSPQHKNAPTFFSSFKELSLDTVYEHIFLRPFFLFSKTLGTKVESFITQKVYAIKKVLFYGASLCGHFGEFFIHEAIYSIKNVTFFISRLAPSLQTNRFFDYSCVIALYLIGVLLVFIVAFSYHS